MAIDNIVKEAIEKYSIENPYQSFYTVVPSKVLYDLSLTSSEFRLLCILLSFLTINGEAYPTNKYLADKFNIKKETVSRLISSLCNKNYIELEFIMEGKEVKKRIIRAAPLLTEIIRGIDKNINRGIDKNVKDNNIKENNINIIVNTPPEFIEFFEYCKTLSIYHSSMDFQIEAKYNSWKENKWKDGNNKQIKNWKTKIQNTMPYFKKDLSNGREPSQQRRKDFVTKYEYESELKNLYEGGSKT